MCCKGEGSAGVLEALKRESGALPGGGSICADLLHQATTEMKERIISLALQELKRICSFPCQCGRRDFGGVVLLPCKALA